MLFPVEELFSSVLVALAEAIAVRSVPPQNRLPCDRYVARSALQKAVRRAEPGLAQRALATLWRDDPRGVWRHLAIICVEDVGVANVDLLSQIVAARRNTMWRRHVGGDWAVLAEQARQMAISEHCQSACDLLLKALNDPGNEAARVEALDAEPGALAAHIANETLPVEFRGVAALALGGGLAEGQPHVDPCAVFDLLAETGRGAHITAACRAAWKLTRNPMALLLPLLWALWIEQASYAVRFDPMQPIQMIHGVPACALDQFTRLGNTASRQLLARVPMLHAMLAEAGIAPAAQPRAVGDLLFLIEGGLLANRVIWLVADGLRLPHRWLSVVRKLAPDALASALAHVAVKGRQIAQIRRELLISKT